MPAEHGLTHKIQILSLYQKIRVVKLLNIFLKPNKYLRDTSCSSFLRFRMFFSGLNQCFVIVVIIYTSKKRICLIRWSLRRSVYKNQLYILEF